MLGMTVEVAPTLQLVCEELASVSYKWEEISVQLGVPYGRLMVFKSQPDPLVASVNYWLRGNVEGAPVSWKSIVKALTSSHVGESGLAKKNIASRERKEVRHYPPSQSPAPTTALVGCFVVLF